MFARPPHMASNALHRAFPPARICSKVHNLSRTSSRYMMQQATQNREGDISDAFISLQGKPFTPLDPRFADVKRRLIAGHEDAICDSWYRLLQTLREEIPVVAEKGSSIIPEIEFRDIESASPEFRAEHRKRGVAIVRGVLPESEALDLKTDLQAYIAANPQTRAFPKDNPAVYELYWSKSQVKAMAHPNMIQAQKFLMKHWHSQDPRALVSSDHPMAYADRLRIRQPGDASFALGPHVDNGSCERWEAEGYGKGGVYDAIFEGRWEDFDAWESSCRLDAVADLYQGLGAPSVFRMFQGWLAMSHTGPFEGTLLVNPLFSRATAYYLLRPFFSPKRPRAAFELKQDDAFLAPENWELHSKQDSWLHGAHPGHGQELSDELHPHLDLAHTMVHIPRVRPGDYVSWHCDTIHAVDKVHAGEADSSVMYIPSCPLTIANATFAARQREAFISGMPNPDFPGGVGESKHIGRAQPEDVVRVNPEDGLQVFGLKLWDHELPELSAGQREVIVRSNDILGLA